MQRLVFSQGEIYSLGTYDGLRQTLLFLFGWFLVGLRFGHCDKGSPSCSRIYVFIILNMIEEKIGFAHAYNLSTWKAEAGGLLRAQCHLGLQSETLSPKNKHKK